MVNELLAARVRSKLRLSLPHSESISIQATESRVVLGGAVLAEEIPAILEVTRKVAGVSQIENALEGVVPGRKGRGRSLGRELGLLGAEEEGWSPGARALAGAGAAWLLAVERRRGAQGKGGALSPFIHGLGASLALRAVANIEAMRLLLAALRPEIRLERSISVDAPVEDVFDFWKNFSNYPRFMSYVREVKVNDFGGLSWTLQSPYGKRFSWAAELTSLVNNREIGWKSVRAKTGEGLVRNFGRIRFETLDRGERPRTRVKVVLAYGAAAGAFGLAASKALGFDPRARFDGDLALMKTLVERRSP